MSEEAVPHEQDFEPLTPQARNLAEMATFAEVIASEDEAEMAAIEEQLEGLPDEPSIDLGARSIKRRSIDETVARAMSGQLPRYRALKSWEPDKLDERHLQAVMMRASGLSQNRIAERMGWEPAWVSVILNHPDAQYVLTRIVSYAADNVIDLSERIRANAPEAFDTVLEVMRSTNDEKLRSANAFEILKMAGYGAKTGPQLQVNTQINQGVSPKAMGQLASAIRDSMRIQEVSYEVLPAVVSESEGSGSPVSLDGSQDVAEPPGGDSPAQAEAAA